MTKGGRAPTPWPWDQLWTLSADRRTIRLQLPPATEGEFNASQAFVDIDAMSVDELLNRLIGLRARMLPAPPGY